MTQNISSLEQAREPISKDANSASITRILGFSSLVLILAAFSLWVLNANALFLEMIASAWAFCF